MGLFYLSNFPATHYGDLDLDKLDVCFRRVSKDIAELCCDNDSYLQVIFSLFNLRQKTGGITLNMTRIRDFILKDNMNVHYELMNAVELVSVPLYLSILFQNDRLDFVSFFEKNILPNLVPFIPQLQTAEISQLMVMFSNFEYKK